MDFLDCWIFEVVLHEIFNIHMSTRPEGFWTWIKSCYEHIAQTRAL